MSYTNKQAQAIRRAFSALEYMAQCFDTKASGMLANALKIEAKDRGSRDTARALLVSSAATLNRANAESLYSIAPGCRDAAMLGGALRAAAQRQRKLDREAKAEGRDSYGHVDLPKRWAEFLKLAQACEVAHREYIDKRLSEIGGAS